jgi:hypothetical protein
MKGVHQQCAESAFAAISLSLISAMAIASRLIAMMQAARIVH